MVARKDLRPTRPDDSLKRLVNQVNNPQTVPHGVKVAQPGEYVEFFDSSYQAHRWDGDAIADFDSRLSEAKAAISQAEESLATTEQNLAGAAERIKAVEGATAPEAIGDTAAAQINDRQLIVGRDAVVPGTLDVAQLNVTEQMSAAFVSAMSMESKKLVVTEEAIMNQLTVVQDIVTPSLVAERVNSALITGSVLQTSSLDNTGVKISNTGYKAYDTSGNLAVNLDGRNNFVYGTFRTAPDGKAGVKISQTNLVAATDYYPTTAGMSDTYPDRHGAVFFDSSSRFSENGLVVAATQKAALADSDPQMLLMPQIGIAFNGKFARAVGTAMQAGVVEGNSIEKGSWWTMNVTFMKPLTTDPAVFISPITENGVELDIGIKNATRFGFTATVCHNTASRSSGHAWLKWVALAI